MLLRLGRHVFEICATIAVLLACTPRTTSPLPSQLNSKLLTNSFPSSGYQVLYEFRGDINSQMDGDFPYGNLIAVKDKLYGTTVAGGDLLYSNCGGGKFFAGCGTVFEVNTSGRERVLYRFVGGNDGFYPEGGLLGLNGTLYGTTTAGGSPRCDKIYGKLCGTVFALSLSGQERVLHSFAGSPDGAGPSASLIAVNGALYGTTVGGGYSGKGCGKYYGGCGVVFQITTSGNERVVYAFRGGKDGAVPSGPLLLVNGALYGMTAGGGSTGCGTVFKVSTSGSESIVYSFNGAHDGCRPVGGLVAIKGMLYGVTARAGGRLCGCGTVFKLSTTGKEQPIHRFKIGGDGRQPAGSLIALKGMLYGTTVWGGTGCSASLGCGTVFEVTTSGIERVLYGFKGGNDGGWPEAGLWALRGTLYGTTSGASAYICIASYSNCGTVFKILP